MSGGPPQQRFERPSRGMIAEMRICSCRFL
jgi:hypothetical protein